MLRQLRHRGPDGEGILERGGDGTGSSVVLGHRRLSIIDLSPAAAQPMTSADGRLHIILNGEIYNYLELRAELVAMGRHFRTQSDTEVLLEAWSVWGKAALDRVVGMFAFALLDERRRTLTLARDQFGIKPLYYTTGRSTLSFASEIPPLLDLPGVGRAADPGPVADFLARGGNNHTGRTMFADVRELPGAHLAEIPLDTPTELRPSRYWGPPTTLLHDLSLVAAADRLRGLLEDSVRLHLRSDVPVGMLLSGGKDSSSVLMLARRVLGAGPELKTFSYRGEDGAVDEARWIEAARAAAGATGYEIRLTPDEWARDLRALVVAQGEPFGSPVIYAQRRLFQEAAAAGVRVVLDGQGSDEYLAGYDRFHPGRLASLLRHGRYLEFSRVARGYASAGGGWHGKVAAAAALRWPALRRLRRLRGTPRPTLLNGAWVVARGTAVSPPWQPVGRDVLREMLGAALTSVNIAWLMRFADRNAMAFSVENRVPFLNPRVVEFVLGLPEEHFISADGTGKQLLRKAMEGIVPDVILGRRDKVGFDVPVESWLPRTPGLADLLQEALTIPAVNREPASRFLDAVRRGSALPRPRAFEAWRLVTLAAWSREFGVVFR
jgi:asparagine synthase (glutamine-hydrolysing)